MYKINNTIIKNAEKRIQFLGYGCGEERVHQLQRRVGPAQHDVWNRHSEKVETPLQECIVCQIIGFLYI